MFGEFDETKDLESDRLVSPGVPIADDFNGAVISDDSVLEDFTVGIGTVNEGVEGEVRFF